MGAEDIDERGINCDLAQVLGIDTNGEGMASASFFAKERCIMARNRCGSRARVDRDQLINASMCEYENASPNAPADFAAFATMYADATDVWTRRCKLPMVRCRWDRQGDGAVSAAVARLQTRRRRLSTSARLCLCLARDDEAQQIAALLRNRRTAARSRAGLTTCRRR